MNGLMKWDPFRELEDFQNRLSSFFGRPMARHESEADIMNWSPSVDILEDDKEFLVKVDLPEVKKEDVQVSVEDDVLTIRGERKSEAEEKGKRFHRTERSYGAFVRSFSLPESADPRKVRAEFKDGLLKVHLAKSEKARPQPIQVQVE